LLAALCLPGGRWCDERGLQVRRYCGLRGVATASGSWPIKWRKTYEESTDDVNGMFCSKTIQILAYSIYFGDFKSLVDSVSSLLEEISH
jgi:hypothetical protein